MENTQNYSAVLLDSVARKLHEVEITPEDALDDIVAMDPQTELGKAMTEVMVDIANLNLFDYYIGYDRKGNTISILMSGEAPGNRMQDLVDLVEKSIEQAPDEEDTSYIKATLRREEGGDAPLWILKLSIYSTQPDVDSDLPVETDLGGDVSVNDQNDSENEGEPAGTGETIPEE